MHFKWIKRALSCFSAAVMTLSVAVYLPSMQRVTAADSNAKYPVQEVHIGVGDTNRNINIAAEKSGAPLDTQKDTGSRDSKWSLNYVSDGVYEIVNSATGYVITNNNGSAVISPDKDAANQRWKIVGTDKDFDGYYLYYKIVSNADSSAALTFD